MVRFLSSGALISSRLRRTESPAGAAAPCPLSQLKVSTTPLSNLIAGGQVKNKDGDKQ
jgi:hypothetical protein